MVRGCVSTSCTIANLQPHDEVGIGVSFNVSPGVQQLLLVFDRHTNRDCGAAPRQQIQPSFNVGRVLPIAAMKRDTSPSWRNNSK
jgi:hypothetical protein